MNKEKKVDILIVDDRPENLFVMMSILENEKVNIVKASSGEQALSLMFDYDFALVLLDVQMPGMDGFETAELMRGSEKTAHIPIIFVTAISKEQISIFKGYDVGAVDYLFKPIEPVILKSKVKIFIDLFKQKALLEQQTKMLEEKISELIELKEANWKLENLSLIDGLTCISNRRSFDRSLYMNWGNCIRHNTVLSLIMIDIDYFKNYNDNYGHLAGDGCLVKVAAAIDQSVKRPLDMAARYGGEEFAVILPEVNKEGALKVADIIRENVESLKIPHEFSAASKYVTVSLGVSSVYPREDSQIDDFIIAADTALYKAKDNGRNSIVYNDTENR